ncbi:MAG: hypothetical protein ACHQAX_04105 [Gammaproteobacteria bacterium]
MVKIPSFDATTLAQYIVHSVNAAMPIGPSNIKEGPARLSSQERTGGWSETVIAGSHCGFLSWSKWEQEGPWEIKLYTDIREFEAAPSKTYENNSKVIDLVASALRAAMYKAGNCDDMSDLGMIQLCQWIASIPDAVPIPPFSFQIIAGVRHVAAHACLKISLNGKHVICDPWLKEVFEINDQNLDRWQQQFENTEVPPDSKKDYDDDERAVIWEQLKKNIKSDLETKSVLCSVSSREEAKNIAAFYERSYQQSILSSYGKNLFNEKDMTSSLMWNEAPVYLHYEILLRVTSPDYYVKQNIKLIKEYIDKFEFSGKINKTELKEYVSFYLYLLTRGGFSQKSSLYNIVRIMNTLPFKELCKISCVNMASMDALKLYGGCVLSRLDPQSGKASSLRSALESDDPLVAVCDALNIKQNQLLGFWAPPDSWTDMPDTLKDFVTVAIEQKKPKQGRLP